MVLRRPKGKGKGRDSTGSNLSGFGKERPESERPESVISTYDGFEEEDNGAIVVSSISTGMSALPPAAGTAGRPGRRGKNPAAGDILIADYSTNEAIGHVSHDGAGFNEGFGHPSMPHGDRDGGGDGDPEGYVVDTAPPAQTPPHRTGARHLPHPA